MNMLTTPDNLIPSYEQFMAARSERSPTDVSWPPTLPIELALRIGTPQELRVEYGYSEEDWAALPRNPAFVKDLKDACELVRQEGMSFKLKSRMLAEENLKTVWKMIHASEENVPATVKAKLIELTTRWAGLDPRTNGEYVNGVGAVAANTLNIQINLSEANQ